MLLDTAAGRPDRTDRSRYQPGPSASRSKSGRGLARQPAGQIVETREAGQMHIDASGGHNR
ncbi:uncharacterized protein L969DRAFT_43612 [Mixia osmundae IAM 14324]|uniref:Uncharacterized protein n=1 Tax=Mixia osmundae (strain CBS 9802 / IAM 14324 / JCM 22182 / KY 12970) TaxID=764103 RepID=G7E2V9_MIXOS|nr:uncharacterized protein L969DRAFT_43612 [Mixia osmundae IAM 14324]KEI42407.1 hypothetical protein L969DRAFT_43612 [Mixia osmundae IAM 14324]GAA97303.1 hypothetical protein E5Q_03981 [Mixia osmundae IAM 14324]